MKIAKKVVYIGWTGKTEAYDKSGNKIKGNLIAVDDDTEFTHHVTGYGEVKVSKEKFEKY